LENQRLQLGQQRALAEVRSSRRTTEQWADIVLNAPRDAQSQATLLSCLTAIDEKTIRAKWIACHSDRQQMSAVTCEDSKGKDAHDVQTVITSAAVKCCQGGPLCYRDTHRSCYPSNHMIDASFVSAHSPCAVDDSRVTFGELVAFAEYKFDLQQEGARRGAAIQCNDRVYEIKESSSARQFAVFFIADKLDIRFFRWDRNTEEFVSTDSLPFLRDQEAPTSGFALFYRFCQSKPLQLGAPDPPMCPVLTDKYKLYLLRDGAGIKANVYRAQSDAGNFICKHFPSRQHYEREASALRRVVTHTVPSIVEDRSDLLALLLKPCGITLREAEFDVQLLKTVAASCADALRTAHLLQPTLCHFDPSPDNIIVWWDADRVEKVCLNDWGSAAHAGRISSTAGTNPIYRCPELGYAFEMSGAEGAEFDYTPLSDWRALFISLLAFSVHPRKHGDMELPGLLPWERAGSSDMQKTKRDMLRDQKDFWKDFRPGTQQLLGQLRSLLFQQKDGPSLEAVYAAFKNLGPQIPAIAENDLMVSAVALKSALIGHVTSTDGASSISSNAHASSSAVSSSIVDPVACGCGVGTQSDEACKSNSRCRCVRSLPIGRPCGPACKCGDKCRNPHTSVPSIVHVSSPDTIRAVA